MSAQLVERQVSAAASPKLRVFVRVVSLPTTKLARARAAVELQLDRLSPVPRDEVVFDVAPLGASVGAATRYAVGIVGRDDLTAAGALFPEQAFLRESATADGVAAQFRFRNPVFLDHQNGRLISLGVNAVVLISAVVVLLTAIDYRLGRELARAQQRASTSEARLEALHRRIADQNSVWADWRSATEHDLPGAASCAFEHLRRAGHEVRLSSMSSSSGAVNVTFASMAVSAELLSAPGITWIGPRRGAGATVSISREACR